MQVKHCIVGAGPVGLTLGLMLKKFKIPFIILEKNQQLSTHPSAHYINMRSREVFEEIEGINYKLEKAAEPIQLFRNYSYVKKIGNISYIDSNQFNPSPQERFQELLSKYSFGQPMHLPQNKLVSILYDSIRDKVQLSHQIVEVRPNGQNYDITCKNGALIQSQFIYGCDGLNGFIRNHAEIPLFGQQNIQNFVNIHFNSKQLLEHVSRYNSMLTFVYNQDVVCVLIKHSISDAQFTLQIPVEIIMPNFNKEKLDAISTQYYLNLIQGISELTLEDIDIQQVGLWKMGAVVAKRYFSNNIVLVGDSAHGMPPAGGFGMNTGIQDAHNLAHRINILHQNNYDKIEVYQSFLDYERERQKIAYENINTSMIYYRRSLEIASSLGYDYNNLQLYKSFVGGLDKLLPGIYRQGLKIGSKIVQVSLGGGQAKLKKLEQTKGLIPLVFPEQEVEFSYGEKKESLVGKLIPNLMIHEDEKGLRHLIQTRIGVTSQGFVVDLGNHSDLDLDAIRRRFPKFSYVKASPLTPHNHSFIVRNDQHVVDVF